MPGWFNKIILWSILFGIAHTQGCRAAGEGEADTTATLKLDLRRGAAAVRLIHPARGKPAALALFGSGDGGWSAWEQTVAGWMSDKGWLVAGIDLRDYAASDYDAATLGQDYAKITAEVLQRESLAKVPVYYGGWSMGAVQAVAAAAWQGHPAGLRGLFLFSAGARGRYGLRAADEVGIEPEGEGTFSTATSHCSNSSASTTRSGRAVTWPIPPGCRWPRSAWPWPASTCAAASAACCAVEWRSS